MKKNYIILINNQLVRDHNDCPYRCTLRTAKAISEENIKKGAEVRILKIKKDVEVGGV